MLSGAATTDPSPSSPIPQPAPAIPAPVIPQGRCPRCPRCPRFGMALLVLLFALVSVCGGCATVRVSDPERTATEQFLENVAIQQAISQLNMDGLRDQLVYVDPSYLFPPLQHPVERQLLLEPSFEHAFLLGELRARLLKEGVRLTEDRNAATIIMEVRSAGVGIDRYEYLLGLPAGTLGSIGGSVASSATAGATAGAAAATPDLAILKSTRQKGYASVAFVAYRAKTGELLTQSGPFIGRTLRSDIWIFGTGPRTVGNIPPAEPNK